MKKRNGNDLVTVCEECGCRLNAGMRAFRDGSHVVCGDCSDKFYIFLLMCEYVNCDTDSVQGRRIKGFLDKKFKRNTGRKKV